MAKKEISEIIHGKVDIQIGKKGINSGLLDQIKDQFKHSKYLKVRFLDLHFFNNMEEAINNLAKQTNSTVIDIRGKTAVIQRKKIAEQL